MPITKQRAIRIDDEVWQLAQARASLEHRTVSEIVRVALRAYGEDRYDAIEKRKLTR